MRRIAFKSAVVFSGAFVGCVSLDDNARGVRDAKKRIQEGELVKTMGKSEEYVQGFDSVMKPEIDRRFDGEFFDRIRKQVVEQNAKKTQE